MRRAAPAETSELMDDPAADPAEMRAAYEDLEVSNRWLGGHAAVVPFALDLCRAAARSGARPVLVADLAGGGGDLALALSNACAAAAIDARVVVIDTSPHAAAFASARLAARWPLTAFVRGDALAPPLSGTHVAMSSQFLHHVPVERRGAALAALLATGSVGAVVADLARNAWARVGVAAFGVLARRRRYFRHDGPVSVRRGFTLGDAARLARETGLAGVRVERLAFSRLAWVRGPMPQ